MSVSAIILAAGTGERFGKEKQFVEFQGKPLWRHVYNKCLDANIFESIVIVGVDGADETYLSGRVFFLSKGGKTRQESVFYGLHKIRSKRVVILEAARPLVTVEQIKTIATHTGHSVSFVAPAVETIIYQGEHLDRNSCEILQVPQAFTTMLLVEAHMMTCETNATDDTVLMRKMLKIRPDLIPGGHNLFKITYPHDIKVLEHIDESLNNGR